MLQELTEEIENTARAITEQIHTTLPGRIIEFDERTCTVKASIYGKFITSTGEELDYPIVTEAPLVFPISATGNTGIAFPVMPGDDCLILISEVELDEWRTGKEADGNMKFDLTSAIVLPGLMKSNNLIKEATKKKAVIINNKDNKIIIDKNGMEVISNKIKLVSNDVTVAGKSLKVEGDIIYTGNCKKA